MTETKTSPAKPKKPIKTFTKPKCPECDSSMVMFVRRKSMHWCRVCGAEWAKK